jgi:transcriptional regulator with XRE-family HTH domain
MFNGGAHDTTPALAWKLRRVACGLRQQDVSNATAITMTRYSAIERGECTPTEIEVGLIEEFLPPLPAFGKRKGAQELPSTQTANLAHE